MKRTILFAVLLSLLTVSVSAQKAKAPERQGYDDSLYGNVESITIIKYKLTDKFGEIIKDGIEGKKIYKFNQQGDVIEWACYNSDGSLSWKVLYKYDSQGNKIETAWYNSDGSLRVKTLRKYDSQGNWIEKTSYKGETMKPTSMEVREIVYR